MKLNISLKNISNTVKRHKTFLVCRDKDKNLLSLP